MSGTKIVHRYQKRSMHQSISPVRGLSSYRIREVAIAKRHADHDERSASVGDMRAARVAG